MRHNVTSIMTHKDGPRAESVFLGPWSGVSLVYARREQ